MAAPKARFAAAVRRFQKITTPNKSTTTTPAAIDQRTTLLRWPLTQLALLAAAWANLSFFRA